MHHTLLKYSTYKLYAKKTELYYGYMVRQALDHLSKYHKEYPLYYTQEVNVFEGRRIVPYEIFNLKTSEAHLYFYTLIYTLRDLYHILPGTTVPLDTWYVLPPPIGAQFFIARPLEVYEFLLQAHFSSLNNPTYYNLNKDLKHIRQPQVFDPDFISYVEMNKLNPNIPKRLKYETYF